MAINPPSDIVLGVANAADPQKLRAAAALLARADGSGIVDNASLTGPDAGVPSLAPRTPAPKTSPVFDPQANASPLQRMAAKKSTPDAYTKFEAFLVQTFVESMLPSDAPHVFGGGIAGKMWKSMLAEHIANQIAKGTGFGIADKIAKDRERRSKAEAHGTSPTHKDAQPGDAKAGAISALHNLISAPAQPQAALPVRREIG